MASEDELNLLVIVMDVNPIWWGQQAQREPEFTLSKCLDAVMVMGNSHMAMTTTNRLAVISSHFQDSHFLYPCKNWTGGDGAWDGTMDEAPYCGDGKYELLSVANNVVAEEMKRVMSTTEMKGNSTDTLLAGSLAKALCYIHRMTKELEAGQEMKSRILTDYQLQSSTVALKDQGTVLTPSPRTPSPISPTPPPPAQQKPGPLHLTPLGLSPPLPQ
uniref:General transcription factor IIH subunit 3 n=1 Tax=Gadus morhua TaxID=8049 RepID=A0A8C5AYJ0_GADMO